MLLIGEPTQEATKQPRAGSKPTVRRAVIVPPPGMSPVESATIQRSPSVRTVSRPLPLNGLPSGPFSQAACEVHSPTSCMSHWCSGAGFGSSMFGLSMGAADGAAVVHQHVVVDVL